MKLSKREARRMIIQASGLHKNKVFGTGKNAVFRTVQHLGYIQIDTISVVERAHHHVLATRVPSYQLKWLDQLQKEGKILEYWAHAAAYLPMEDFRFTLPLKKYFAEWKDPWPKSDRRLMAEVLQRIEKEGPLMARDFHSTTKRQNQGWWDWKPAKLALERLFFQGSLITIGRSGFQKIYDIPERAIPDHIMTTEPTREEYANYLIEGALRSHGLATISEISYLRKNVKNVVKTVLSEKLEKREVVEVSVSGLEGIKYYALQEGLNANLRINPQVRILSPFDNLTIQRERMKNFFDFDYQIECYVPAPKRVHGYFCLPLLYGDVFVGRMDAKADRKNKKLIVRNLIFEGKKYLQINPEKMQRALMDFAGFNDCEEIVFERSNDVDFMTRMSKVYLSP